MKYTVIIEKGPTSYGAYLPDLPGCIAAGESREETSPSSPRRLETTSS